MAKLADTLSENLRVQSQVLAAASVQKDHELRSRVIQRLQKLAGDGATSWRIAKARLLLASKPNNDQIREAAELLGKVLDIAPNSVDARLLLAACHRLPGPLNSPKDVLTHLQEANSRRPSDAGIALDYVQALLAQDQADRARSVLVGLRGMLATPEQRRMGILLLESLGDINEAMALAATLGEPTTRSSADGIVQARLHLRKGDPQKAAEIFKKLLESPTLETVAAAADFYASQRNLAEAERVLRRLDELKVEPWRVELVLADFASRYRGSEAAMKHFEKARELSPQSPEVWRRLMQFQMESGNADAAIAAAKGALSALGSGREFSAVVDSAELVQVAAGDPYLRPLLYLHLGSQATTLPSDQLAMAEVARNVLTAWHDSMKQRTPVAQRITDLLQKVRPLADAHPKFMSLQNLVANLHLAMGQWNEAYNVAVRTSKIYPTAVEPLRIITRSHAGAQRWSEAKAAALLWKQHVSPSQAFEVDILIAEAALRARSSDEAMRQVAPYLEAARANPDQAIDVIRVHVIALAQMKRHKDAAEVLWPLMKGSLACRTLGLILATHGLLDAPTAAAWLDQIAAVIPGDRPTEHGELARARAILSVRASKPEQAEKAREIVQRLLADPQQLPAVVAQCAIVYNQLGDLPAAEKTYRRCLQAKPDEAVVQNNLAMLLADRNDPVLLGEAHRLAISAVKAEPIANYLDTLAYVEVKRGDLSAALAAIDRAVEAAPGSPEYRIHRMEILLQSGTKPELQRALADIDAKHPDGQNLAEDLRQRLAKIRQAMTQARP